MVPPLSGGGRAGEIIAFRSVKTGAIIVIEDDPEVSDLLSLTLTKEGYFVLAAAHGEAAFSASRRRRSCRT